MHAQVSETVKELTQQKQMKKSSSIASFVGLRASGAMQSSTSPRAPAMLATPPAMRRNVSAQDLNPSPAPSSGTLPPSVCACVSVVFVCVVVC